MFRDVALLNIFVVFGCCRESFAELCHFSSMLAHKALSLCMDDEDDAASR